MSPKRFLTSNKKARFTPGFVVRQWYNIFMLSTYRIVENVFFFGFMAIVAYMVWQMFLPFLSALALSAIIVTICYPMYNRILGYMPKRNETLAALVATLSVVLVVILPLLILSSLLVAEAVSIYRVLGDTQYSLAQSLNDLEAYVESYVPGAELNFTEYIRQSANWLASNLGAIFAGTASTIFLFFISMIGSFYFFRDGKLFTQTLIRISPLPDDRDELILQRLGTAIRSVVTGTLLIALIQGTLTAIGMAIFGFERAVLLGTLAAFGALIPSVGTSVVFVPAILYLLFTGSYLSGIGLLIWGTLAVGLIDNLLGPYLMSRRNSIHPFLILLSVLGGVSLFGPIGFMVGPVLVSLLLVLLELYGQHIAKNNVIKNGHDQ